MTQLRKRVQDYELKVLVDADNEDAIDELMDTLAHTIEDMSSVELGAIIGDIFEKKDTSNDKERT